MANNPTIAQQIAQRGQGTWNYTMNRADRSFQANRAEAERAVRNSFGRDPKTGQPYPEPELREAFKLMAQARSAGQRMTRTQGSTPEGVPQLGRIVGMPASTYTQGRGNRCYQIAFFVNDNGQERRFTALLRTDRFSLSYAELQNRVRFLIDKYRASIRQYDPSRADSAAIAPVMADNDKPYIEVLSVTDCE